jgi:hypothetical protein
VQHDASCLKFQVNIVMSTFDAPVLYHDSWSPYCSALLSYYSTSQMRCLMLSSLYLCSLLVVYKEWKWLFYILYPLFYYGFIAIIIMLFHALT